MPGTTFSVASRAGYARIVFLVVTGMVLVGPAGGQVTVADPAMARILDLHVSQETGIFGLSVVNQTGEYCSVLQGRQDPRRAGTSSIALAVDPPTEVSYVDPASVFSTAAFEEQGPINGEIVSIASEPDAVVVEYRANLTGFVGEIDPVEIERTVLITQRTQIVESADQTGLPLPDTLRVELTVRTESESPFTADLRLMLDPLIPRHTERPDFGFPPTEVELTDTPVFSRGEEPTDGIEVLEATTEVMAQDETRLWIVDGTGQTPLPVLVQADGGFALPTSVMLAGFTMLDAFEGLEVTLAGQIYALNQWNAFYYLVAEERAAQASLRVDRPNTVSNAAGDSGLIYYWRGLEVSQDGITVAITIRPRVSTFDLPLDAVEAVEYLAPYMGSSAVGPVSGDIVIDRNLFILDRPLEFVPNETVLRFNQGKSLYLYSDRPATFEGVVFTSSLPEPAPGAWGGIFVSSGSLGTPPLDAPMTFRNCVFEYAGGEDVTRYAVYDQLQIDPELYPGGRGPVPLAANPNRPGSGHAVFNLLNANLRLEDCIVRQFTGSVVIGTIDSVPEIRGLEAETDDENAIVGVTFVTTPTSFFQPGGCIRGFEHLIYDDTLLKPLQLSRSITWSNTELPYVPEADVEIPVNLTLTIDPPDGSTEPVRVEIFELVDMAQANQYSDRVEFLVFGALRIDPDFPFEAPTHVRPAVVFDQLANPFPDPEADPLQPVVPGPPGDEWPPIPTVNPVLPGRPTPTPAPEEPPLPFMAQAADLAVAQDAANAPPPQQGVPGNWGGIWIYQTSDDGFTRIHNAQIRRGVVGLYVRRASPLVTHCIVEHAADYGLFCDRDANPDVIDCEFLNCDYYGIAAIGNSTPRVQRCRVSGSPQAGVLVAGLALPQILESSIRENAIGVDIYESASPNLGHIENARENDDGRNLIFNNSIDGRGTPVNIRNNTSNEIFAQNNFWGTSNPIVVDEWIIDDDENARAGQVIFMPIGRNATPVPSGVPPTPTMTPAGGPFLPPTDTPTDDQVARTLDKYVYDEDLTLDGRYRIEDTLVVRGFATLTIAKGSFLEVVPTKADGTPVEIRVQDGAVLHVRGTRNQPVVMTSTDPNVRWGGLVLQNPSRGPDGREVPTTIFYADISYAEVGLNVRGASPFVWHCEFHNNRHALRVEALGDVNNPNEFQPAAPKVRNCLFTRQLAASSLLLLNNATPDLGDVELDDPGLNSFYLNDDRADAFDIAASGLFGLEEQSIKAEGNHFTVRRPDGGIERVDDPVLIGTRSPDPNENRDRLNDVAIRLVDIDPLGQVLGEEDVESVLVGRTMRDAYVVRDQRVFQGEIPLDKPLLIARTGRVRALAGTRFAVQPGLQITVNVLGQLDCQGTAAAPVRFESVGRKPFESGEPGASAPRGIDWAGLQFFENSNNDENVLRFCRIADAQIGISCYRASPTLDRCQIFNIDERGIFVTSEVGQLPQEPSTTPTPVPGTLSAEPASAQGVDPFGRPSPRIVMCDIVGGDYGLYSDNALPVVRRCSITGSLVSGVYAIGQGVPDLGVVDAVSGSAGGGNRIEGHVLYNVINQSIAPINAQGNYWGTTDPGRIDLEILDNEEVTRRGPVLTSPALFVSPLTLVSEMGDLDGDAAVLPKDLVQLLEVWHAGRCQPDYTIRADFDRNLKIDHDDLVFFTSQLRGRP